MLLSRLPRVRLAHLPTPLEHLPRLSRHLGGPEIWIKRDDCTGLSSGGNKTRKLEFLMAEAQARQADIVLTQGATQSNHARQTAAAAARLGFAGLCGIRADIALLGIGVRAPRDKQEDTVYELAAATAELCGCAGAVSREQLLANCDYVGAGYGISTPASIAAIELLARLEGILLDPVYSGKGMSGLIELVRKGRFTAGQNVVFIHTGGSVGLFGYVQEFGPRG